MADMVVIDGVRYTPEDAERLKERTTSILSTKGLTPPNKAGKPNNK